MTQVLVDSSVILDIATRDARWFEWSRETLARVAEKSQLVINPIIFGEASVRYATIEEVESFLPSAEFRREPIPYDAAFLAGKAFVRYRRHGGSRRSPLPDFFIGAHAAVAGYQLLTRDATRIRHYFPTVKIISP
ncbi:type II toxin-antitoxin system VapC family toxin [bacterium]|nr:type II toxin-antitoxin system VapC family toxin [bacterium]